MKNPFFSGQGRELLGRSAHIAVSSYIFGVSACGWHWFSSQRLAVISWVVCMLCMGSYVAEAQVTLVLNRIPENTPAEAWIYIAGNFNDWKPNLKDYQLTRRADGKYSITLPSHLSALEYKFTRGSWETVEGDLAGNKIANRTFLAKPGVPITLLLEIKNWEDLKPDKNYTIVVDKIPANTPHDASLYMAGDFNNWKPNDVNFQLSKQLNGAYSITIPRSMDTVKYRFTRGTWSSVECQSNGHFLFNRVLTRHQHSPAVVHTQIQGWEDLANGPAHLYTFLLLISAFLGLLLTLAFQGYARKNQAVNQLLIALLLLTGLAFVGRLAAYNRDLFLLQPKIILLSDTLYFLYAPLFYLYLRKLTDSQIPLPCKKWILFIPAGIQLVLYLLLIGMPTDQFTAQLLDRAFSLLFTWMGIVSFGYHAWLWFQIYRLQPLFLPGAKQAGTPQPYVKTMLYQYTLCLVLWLFSYIVYGLALLAKFDASWIIEGSTHLVWVVCSTFTYTHAYFALHQPEMFRLPLPSEQMGEKPKSSSAPTANIDGLKDDLARLMRQKKPFLNSKLTLQDLADLMNINIHSLSRLINEGCNKNFYDFINEYRIEEFKKLVNDPQHKNLTYLAIALEVGFSSKTTFNRAFKKSTGKTPREYFHPLPDEQLERIHS